MKRKQRILLIRTNYLANHMGLNVVPPLGILTLAGVLRDKRPSEVECRVLDMGASGTTVQKATEIFREWEPDVIGLSSLSLEALSIKNLARNAKQLNPDIKVVAGGPHATCFYDIVLQDRNIDYAVLGEGEETLVELLDALRDEEDTSDILGLASICDGQLHYAGPRPYCEDLDSIAVPAWEMIDLHPYTKFISMNSFISRKPYAALFTSRSCPFGCNYCNRVFGSKYRAQSPERVLDEIELLYRKHGVRELHVYDDLFNMNEDRVIAIFEGVQKRGIDMRFAFPNAVRGDLMTRDMIRTMVKGGAYCIGYSVETASPRIQKLIKKNIDLDKLFEVIEWTYEEGSIPGGGFMLGFPTETREDMEMTIQYANRSKFLFAYFFHVVPFPRTDLHKMVLEMYPDRNFQFDPELHFWTDRPYYSEVSGIDMNEVRSRTLKTFYGNPWRIWQILRRFPLSFMRPVLLSFAYWYLGYRRRDESEKPELFIDDGSNLEQAAHNPPV